MQWALLSGALAGLGVTLVIREFVPARPDLAAALDRLSGNQRGSLAIADHTDLGLQARLGLALERLRDTPGLRIPHRDLLLLGEPEHMWLGKKGLAAIFGFLFAPVAHLLFGLVGVSLPLPVPVAASLLLGIFFWFVPDLELRGKAKEAREKAAHSVSAYIELTALERIAGAGTSEALANAADVGQDWVFRRIRETLNRARWSGTSPWEALRELGEELGIPELSDLAAVARLSGEEDASVFHNLRAASRRTRRALLAREQERANVTTEHLLIPGAALGMVFLALILTPFVLRVLGT